MIYNRGVMLGNKKILVDDPEANALTKVQDHFIGKRPPNFDGYVVEKANPGVSLTNATGTINDHDPIMVFSPGRKLDLLDDSIGYLALSVPMDHIAGAQRDDYARSMLTWIVKGKSKIRITAHGDGEGNLEMKGDYMAADCIAKWFHENGLTAKGLLSTISLNFCMSAKCKLTPAVIVNGQYSPAEGSALAIFAKALGDYGVKGVTVTGSNENVGVEQPASMVREHEQGRPIQNPQVFRSIRIPSNFPFEKASYTLTIPKGWALSQKRMADSTLCVIKAPQQFSVTTARSVYQAAQMGSAPKSVTQEYGMYTFIDPKTQAQFVFYEGWIVDEAKKEITGANGWQMVDEQSMKFVGTGGSFALQVGGNAIQIVERLAHSQAKASVIS